METLLSQQLQQAWLDTQMRKKRPESPEPSLQEVTLPSARASFFRPLFGKDQLSAYSVPDPLSYQHEDQVAFNDPVLQYINDMLMKEDMEDSVCEQQLECTSYQATAKGFYKILEEDLAIHGEERSENLEISADFEGRDSAVDSNRHHISAQKHEKGLRGGVHDEYEWMNALLNDVVWSPFDSEEAIATVDSAATLPEGKSLPSTLHSFDQPLGKLASDTSPKHTGRGDRKVKRAASQVADSAEAGQLRPRSSPSSAKVSINGMVNLSKEEAVSSYVQNNDRNAEVRAKVLSNGQAAMAAQALNPHPACASEKRTGDSMDLKGLLLLCAEAVSENEVHRAHELLQVITQHTSLYGSAEQRLAYYFSEGLLARLSNTGIQLFTAFVNTMPSAAHMLKAYRTFVEVCPFFKVSHYFANKSILDAAEGASRLHIVDYGILYGLQWPYLISALAERRGGPPVLRITGIECPRRGSKFVERVELTGQMLSEYAEMFGVPFEYHAIASKFENVQPSAFHLQEGEVLVVNSIFRLRHLLDESTLLASNPRKTVLSRIQAINPKVFVQGVKSANYNAPLFMSRFEAALTFYSHNFDMLDSTMNRENQERMTIEREMMGRDIINVVACEGPDRIERPETYKQWENRTRRAGFEQMPLNQSMLCEAQGISQATYNKNFSIDQDGGWMTLGWKGKVLYGLSLWRPSGQN